MSQPRVLICDDNDAVHESLTRFLKVESIEAVSVYTGKEALEQVGKSSFDLVILDIMLPDISGTDVCRSIREKSNIPIMFLSARGEADDRILGLELGGDDYVAKPFSPREVSLRAKKLLSRMQQAQEEDVRRIISFEELSVDTDTMEVFVNGKKIDMTAKEVQLLEYLINNARKVLNREQILSAVWGYDYFGDTRAVDAAIKRIRKKLPEEGVNFTIQAVYGVGYRLAKNEGAQA